MLVKVSKTLSQKQAGIRHQWLIPAILATWEAEIWRIMV
jgi:hypothetical protein